MTLSKTIMPAAIMIIVLMAPLASLGQQNFWRVLAEVTFHTVSGENGYQVEKPEFSQHLKSFNGKKITVRGYLIPLNEINGKPAVMLSSLPFNVCYFCGGAGPETVIEVDSSDEIKFTSKPVTLEGILRLNENDPDHHIYILTSATLTEQ